MWLRLHPLFSSSFFYLPLVESLPNEVADGSILLRDRVERLPTLKSINLTVSISTQTSLSTLFKTKKRHTSMLLHAVTLLVPFSLSSQMLYMTVLLWLVLGPLNWAYLWFHYIQFQPCMKLFKSYFFGLDHFNKEEFKNRGLWKYLKSFNEQNCNNDINQEWQLEFNDLWVKFSHWRVAEWIQELLWASFQLWKDKHQ